MLKIILGEEAAKRILGEGGYARYAFSYFKEDKKQVWFKRDLSRKILYEIEHVRMDGKYGVYNEEEDAGCSVDDLSLGTKSLLTLANTKKDKVFLIDIEDNCCDLLEEIALEYERKGKELIIVSNYLNRFKFRHIRDVCYINWGITVNNAKDIVDIILPLWRKDQELEDKVYRRYKKDNSSLELRIKQDNVETFKMNLDKKFNIILDHCNPWEGNLNTFLNCVVRDYSKLNYECNREILFAYGSYNDELLLDSINKVDNIIILDYYNADIIMQNKLLCSEMLLSNNKFLILNKNLGVRFRSSDVDAYEIKKINKKYKATKLEGDYYGK